MTAQSWPVAYRRGSSVLGGYQTGTVRQMPANDNSRLRLVPLAEREKPRRQMPYWEVKKPPPPFGQRQPTNAAPFWNFALKQVPLWLLRANPWVRLAATAWDLYTLYNEVHAPPVPNLNQYFVIRDCGRYTYTYFPGNWVCGAVPGVWTDGGDPMPVMGPDPFTFSSVTQPYYLVASGTTRWTNNVSYQRNPGVVDAVPLITPRWDTIAYPPASPAQYWGDPRRVINDIPLLDPLRSPRLDPLAPPEVAAPVPIPYRVVPLRRSNPLRSPSEGHSRGYHYPRFQPGPVTKPETKVVSTVITGIGKTKPLTRPQPVAHVATHLRPARPKEKERKTRAPTLREVMPRVEKLLGVLTEGTEIIDAFYDAIPAKERYLTRTQRMWNGKIREKRDYFAPLPMQKAKIVIQKWKKVDLEKAFNNLLMNEVEDRVIGTMGKLYGQAAAARGRDRGWTVGPAI